MDTLEDRIVKAQNGDEDGLNSVMEDLQGLVYKLCKSFINHDDYEDLIQEGMIALYKAIMGYDGTTGYKFTTYAYPYIQGAFRRYWRGHVGSIKVPRSIVRTNNLIRKALNGYEGSINDIINLGFTEEEAINYLNLYSIGSLDKTIVKDNSITPIMDLLHIEQDDFGEADFKDMIRNVTDSLSDRNKHIIDLHLQGFPQLQIAPMVGLSQVQVSRIVRKFHKEFKQYSQIS